MKEKNKKKIGEGERAISNCYLDVVGVLVIVGGVEDDLRARLGVDVSGRYRCHCCCDVTSDHSTSPFILFFYSNDETFNHVPETCLD